MKKRFGSILLSLLLVAIMVAVGSLAGFLIKTFSVEKVLRGCSSETRAIVKNFAKEHNISVSQYKPELISMLENDPDTADFVLHYPLEKDNFQSVDLSEYEDSETVPLFMQWDRRWGYIKYGSNMAAFTACGPVCLSMVAYYFTRDNAFSPDNIIRFSLENNYYTTGAGSKWTLISEGGVKLGFDVKELPLDENVMVKALNEGKPIIAVMGKGDFTSSGHFIVFTGYSEGSFTVNDPNSYKLSAKKWYYADIKDQFRNLWSIDYAEK